MKKWIMLCSMLLLGVMLAGCGKREQQGTNDSVTTTPAAQPVVTLPAEVTPKENEVKDITEEDLLKARNYYPIEADTEYIYAGEGNEYAGFNRYVDYVDQAKHKLQTRTNNGGTETVRVIEVADGKVSVNYIANECYYRENFLDRSSGEEGEILLMEPLVVGTQWTLPDGRKRFISQTRVPVETPYGTFDALEVTTQDSESITKDYYGFGVGLVKTVFTSDALEVTSTLNAVNRDAVYTRKISLYHPGVDETIYADQAELKFKTGDDSKSILEEVFRKSAVDDTYLPLLGPNTKMNDLSLDKEGIVNVDFSANFVTEMNSGAGYESLILQSIVNTLGDYYGANQVSITLEGKPYESGHILMKEGETFDVEYDDVTYIDR